MMDVFTERNTMSAFIVKDSSINRIVGKVVEMEVSTFQNFMGESDNGAKDLAEALFDMNVAAVSERYPDIDSRKEFHPEEFIYVPNVVDNDVQTLMSVQCLLYQCSEGNIPSFSLYEALERFSAILSDCIIGRLPEYNEAKWG